MQNGESFQCRTQWRDGIACLTLSGDLDLATVNTFRAHLAMATHGRSGILLDLGGLRYLDSSGINAVLETHRALTPFGRRIALVGVSPNVRRILGVLKLEDLMPVFAEADDALAYLRSRDEAKSVSGEG